MRAKLDPRLPERWQPYYASQNLAGSCVWHFFSANTLVLPSSRKPFHSNPHNPVLNLKLLRTSALEIRTSHCWWLLSSQNHSIPNPLTLTQPWGSLRLLRRRWSGGFWGFLQEGGGEGGGFKKAMGKPPFPSPPPFLEEAPPLSAFEEVWHPSIGEICKHHESLSKKLLHGRFQISNAATQWEQQGYSVRLAKTLEVSGCHQSLPPWRLLSVCFPAPWQWHILKLWQLGAGTSNIHRTNFDVGWHSIGTTVQPNENNWQCLRSSSSASLSTWSPSIHGMASAGKLSPASGFMALQMGNHRLEPD